MIAQQLAMMMGGSSVPLIGGEEVYFRFKGDATDYSGNGRNGTLVNAPTLVANKAGVSNESYKFLASSSQKITTSIPNLGAFSVSAWVRLNTQNGVHPVAVFSTSTNAYRGFVYSTSSLVCYYGVGKYKSLAIPYNLWYHLVLTWDGVDGNGLKIYINGLDNTSSLSAEQNTGQVPNVAQLLSVGGTTNVSSQYGDNTIDEVILFNRVISQAEVTAIYNRGV